MAPSTHTPTTYIRHSPDDLSACGKFRSPSARAAAMKATNRSKDSPVDIYLRATNSKIVHHFKGEKIPLDTPVELHRTGQEQPIVHKFRASVKYVGDRTFDDLVAERATPDAST